jgi:hypothetical protein
MRRNFLSERLGGSFVIGYALLSLVAIAHHPQLSMRTVDAAMFSKLVALSTVDEFMHGTMIALLLLLAFGFIILGRARGFDKPAIISALLCAALGIAAPIAAGTIDGFWLPWFGSHMATSDPSQLAIGAQLLAAAGIMIQVASKIGFVGIALAVALFSLDFFDGDRSHLLLGAYGLAAGIGVIVMLATVSSRLTPHTLLAPMFLQTICFLVTGTLLARGQLTRDSGAV